MSALAPPATTARIAISDATRQLARAGLQTPRLDAELLLAHVLETSRARLVLDSARALSAQDEAAFARALERRVRAREPVAYITGRRAFGHIELASDSRALIPRPETELLVEIGVALPRASAVLDVGTGCGAVALALKHERPDLAVSASDVDADALALALENARRLGLEVAFRRADLLAGVADEFDAVLANLPYVAEAERGALAPEIVRHEPPGALFAGPDGLLAIGALIRQAAQRRRLRLLALEVGAGQAPAVAALARARGFARVWSQRDLAGIERVVVAEGRTR